jgi:lysylphosphatidylglycerol synthetase-like protein (DUF2156 family)
MTDVSSTVGFAPTACGREVARTDVGVPAPIRVALLRQHGMSSQAYSATFQAGLEHFGDNRGFLAYKRVGRTALVLSDPLAPPENIPDLISRFLQENSDTYFWHISPRVAQILAKRGFYINAMGPETWIELPTYTFGGEKKKQLRESLNRMVKRGFVTRECALDEVGIDRIEAISDAWRQTRTIRHGEVGFLNRPLVLAEELDVRRFFTFDRDGKLVAFAFFDPIYEAGNLVGYGSQHNRYLPEADHMINFAIKRVAIETFKREGLKVLHLGISPFADVLQDKEFKSNTSWATAHCFNFAYKSWLVNRFIYPNKGIAAHKRLFRGVQRQTYYASLNWCPSLLHVLKLLRACKIV